jgi:hypothetical protein
MPTFASAFAAFIFSAAWMVASSMVAPVLLQPVPMVAIPGYMFAAATSEASGGISLNLPCIPITSLTVSQECVKMAALAVGKKRATNDTMEQRLNDTAFSVATINSMDTELATEYP